MSLSAPVGRLSHYAVMVCFGAEQASGLADQFVRPD